jgi:hypothetical protein
MIRVAIILLLASACAPRGSLGHDLPEGTTGGTTAVETSSTAADDHGTSTHASASASEGDSTSSDTTAHATQSESSTTAADACAPSADDTACNACRKLECCEVWTACHADEVCVCIEMCIAEGGIPLECETVHCAGPSDAWTHVHDCDATNCAPEC